jgi:hypothetical protein
MIKQIKPEVQTLIGSGSNKNTPREIESGMMLVSARGTVQMMAEQRASTLRKTP